MKTLSIAAKLFIGVMIAVGTALIIRGVLQFKPESMVKFLFYLALTSIASRLRVRLPGVNGTMSINLPFFLVVATQLSAAEALLIACAGSTVQSLPRSGAKPQPVRIAFNAATVTSAVALAAYAFSIGAGAGWIASVALVCAAAAFFFGNTIPVSLVLWLSEGAGPVKTWLEIARLTVPYYVLSAGVSVIFSGVRNPSTWFAALLLLFVMSLTYLSFRHYFGEAKKPAKVTEAPAAQAHASRA